MSKSTRREHIFLKRVRAFSREMDGIYSGDVAALHRTRVASRRLRELVPLAGLDRDEAVTIARRLRKVTRRLGAVRELDVLMLAVHELAGKRGYPLIALWEVDAVVAAARSNARARLAAKLPLAKLQRLSRRLERVAGQLESKRQRAARRGPSHPKQAWLWALDVRSIRRASNLKSSIDAAGALYLPERLHQVRIALKKLRYAEELRAEAQGRPASDVTTLRAAQDLLGRLHDLEVLIARTRDVQSLMSASDPMGSHQLGLLVRAVEEDCRRLHQKFMGQRARLVAIAVRIAGVTAPGDKRGLAAG